MIRFLAATKVYPGGRVGLDQVTLEIERGDFVVIAGPSGAGKSTLLRAVTFAVLPDEGEVEVEGQRSSQLRRRDIPRVRRQLGIIYQDFRLLRDRSIYENVIFPLRVLGNHDSRAIRERAMRALHRVGLAHRRNALPRELSGGEQQRTALARALVNDPVYLLADEPAGNLDQRAGDEIFALLREVNLAGTGVLVATHQPARAHPRRDRVIYIENGAARELTGEVPASSSLRAQGNRR
jgi:cell division transport system ATP-binding protein